MWHSYTCLCHLSRESKDTVYLQVDPPFTAVYPTYSVSAVGRQRDPQVLVLYSNVFPHLAKGPTIGVIVSIAIKSLRHSVYLRSNG